MTFKVYYQPSKNTTPRRENTQSLYLEADSEAAARVLVEENTNYNVEFIELLDEKALAYEQENDADFQLTEF
ncbi:DNA-directed RNA polymerase subunit epsilon [Limosilactobacillus fermentum]